MSTLRLNKLSFFDSSDSSVAIDTGSILTGAAAQFKITGGTANQALVTDGAGNLSFADVTSDPTMGGDLSGVASNAQIVADAVGTAEIAADAVTANEIAAGAVGSSEIAADAVGSSEIAADAVGSSEIATGAVGATEIASTIDLSSKTVTLPAASVIAHLPVTPTITSLTYPGSATNLAPAGGETLIITGTNFISGMEVEIGLVAAPTVTVDSATQITITTPALTSATYTLVVIHPNGHRGSISVSYSDAPTWTTGAGSLGSMTELTAGSFTIIATSDSTVTYAQQSGTLPSGLTLNTGTGVIDGTGTSDLAADTLYNFTMRATDLENQYSDRSFGITVNAVPSITSLDYPGDDTALDPAGGQSLIITGASFETGVTTTIDSTSVAVTRDSATQLTIPSTPAKAASTYTNGLVATNPSGLSATADISYSNLPVFNVAAGALGEFDGETAMSITLDATGDVPLTYALTSGALPTGVTLNTTTGVVSGTTPEETDDTTYNFTITVTDPQNQSVSRAYSFIVLSFQVNNSLMFNYGSDSHLHYKPIADGNRRTWTWSAWLKRGGRLEEWDAFMGSGHDGSNRDVFRFNNTNGLNFQYNPGSIEVNTSSVFRDPTAWYHIVLVFDSTQSISTDRVRIYANNVLQPSSGTYGSQNQETWINSTYKQWLGCRTIDGSTPDAEYDGYMSEVHFIDGVALQPSDFAEVKNNQWIPKEYKGTFGGNGYYKKFDGTFDIATTITDSSGLIRNTVPVNGNVHTDTSVKKIGTASAQFGGVTTDYLIVPDSSDWNFGTGDFTFECWFRRSAWDTTYLWDFSDGSDRIVGHIRNDGAGSRIIWFGTGWSNTTEDVDSGALNVWRHLALVRDNGVGRWYLDGVQQNTLSSWTTNFSGTWSARIGDRYTSSNASFDPWEGYIDEFRVSNTCRYPDGTTFTPSTTEFTNDVNTMLLLHCDGSDSGTTFTDSSTRPRHTITTSGDAKQERITSRHVLRYDSTGAHITGPKFGSSSMSFVTGSAPVDTSANDYISVAYAPQFNFGTGDFTIEQWIQFRDKIDMSTPDIRHSAFFTYGGFTAAFGVGHHSGWGSGMRMNVWQAPGTDHVSNEIFGLNDYNWHHIAYVRSNGRIYYYVDGKTINPLGILYDDDIQLVSGTPTVGRSSGYSMVGFMDEVRWSNIARYTADFDLQKTTFTSDANTVLLIHSDTTDGSTTFTDSSSYTHALTAGNDAHHVAPKIGTGMGVFDWPSSNYVVIPESTDWDFGSGDFTMECWVNMRSIDTIGEGFNTFMWLGNYQLDYKVSTTQLRIILQGAGHNLSSTWVPTMGTWYHIAAVRNGADLKLFVDGTQLGSTLDVSTDAVPAGGSGSSFIGCRRPNGDRFFDGYMDEVRVSKTARYTTTFTPSTTAFVDDVNTVLLMHMDGTAFTDSSTNSPIETTSPSFISFGQDTGYLKVPLSSDFNYGSADFTIECWMYNRIVQGDNSFYTQCITTGNTGGMQIEWQAANGNIAVWDYSLASDWTILAGTGTTPTPVDQWYHFAFVRNGDVFKMYINGVAGSTTRTQSGTMDQTLGPSIGFHRSVSSRYLDDSLMAEFRISNIARYTGNFTPSTTPFTTDANTKLLIQGDWLGGYGADSSSNNKDHYISGMGDDHKSIDSPMNNFATLNTVWRNHSGGSVTFSEGNLKNWNQYGDVYWNSTMELPTTGKWYWECYGDANSTRFGLLMEDRPGVTNPTPTTGNKIWYWDNNGVNYPYGTVVDGTAYTLGTICGIGVDVDAGEIKFYKNGVLLYTGTNLNSEGYEFLRPIFWHTDGSTIWANFGQDSTFAGSKAGGAAAQDANNIGEFYYTPPAGHLALCTKNLSDPVIADPSEHMNTVLYTGNSSTNVITGVGFKPDLVWIKGRNVGYYNQLYDSVRGVNLALYSNEQDSEYVDNDALMSFDSDGFTLGAEDGCNNGGTPTNYVSWVWKGNTTPTQTYIVTVAGSMDYYIDGFATAKPILQLQEGGTYTFDESDSTNSSHLFAFSTTADGTFGGGTEYVTGVTHIGTPGQAGAKTTITVASGAPQLYYYCKWHGSMGGTANTDGGSSNFQGNIASAVSANQTAGFSIVSYKGDNITGSTIGHGLSQAPDFVIAKTRDSSMHWGAYRTVPGGSGNLTNWAQLNTNGVFNNSYFCDVNPTTLGLYAGSYANLLNEDFIAYCFHSVEGYSKIGSYTGNGNADGTFVYTGFRPAFILYKGIDSGTGWCIHDNKRDGYNQTNKRLFPDDNGVEATSTGNAVDFVASGFKLRSTGSTINGSGDTYMYLAFAEAPFKIGNAR